MHTTEMFASYNYYVFYTSVDEGGGGGLTDIDVTFLCLVNKCFTCHYFKYSKYVIKLILFILFFISESNLASEGSKKSFFKGGGVVHVSIYANKDIDYSYSYLPYQIIC